MTPELIPEIQIHLYLVTAALGLLSWLLAGSPDAKKIALIITMFVTVINYPVSVVLYMVLSFLTSLFASIMNLLTSIHAFRVGYFFVLFFSIYHFVRRK
jgi:hypothetical protein